MMTIHTIYRYWRRVLGLCLIAFALIGCTYDYFLDENNFRIYIPQLQTGEIENLTIAIHDSLGKHIVTRNFESPFDNDDLMKKGILRFKLPYGDNFKISCFANYAPDALEIGHPYADSYLQKNTNARSK